MMPWEKYQPVAPWEKYKPKEETTEPYKQRDTGGFFETASADIPNPSDLTIEDGKSAASALIRPTLEAGGAVGGAMLTGATPTPLTLLGSGLGYSMGRNAADRIDELMGLREPMSLGEITKQSAMDIPTGAAFEAGGQVIAKAAPPVLMAIKKGGRWVLEKTGIDSVLKAATRSGAEREANAILKAHTSDGVIYAKNAEQAQELEAAIPGLKFTLGQRTNDPSIIKLERTQMRVPGSGADMSVNQIADNTEALRKYYDKSLGGANSIDDVQKLMAGRKHGLELTAKTRRNIADEKIASLEPVQPEQSGRSVLEQISKAEEPVKRGMNVLESAIPDYPMQFTNLNDRIIKAKSNHKLSIDQIDAIEKLQKDIARVIERGQSTFTAMGARRTINNAIDKAFASGADDSAAIILDIKKGLDADITELTKKARTGKIAEYNGRVIEPDLMANQIEKDSTTLAKMKGSIKPDVQAMRKELSDTGYPSMQVVHEGDAEFAKRIERDYINKIGKEVPFTSDKAQIKAIEGIETRIAQNKDILSKASPGQDVAASMRAYNEFASTEYFGRFDKGAVKLATAKGTQASGKSARAENIPSYFTTPTGADDLIRAIGKDKSAGIMKGHFAYDMMQNATNPSTGQVVEKKLSSWYAKNRVVLKKLGIDDYFSDIQKATQTADAASTAIADFEKSSAARLLNADPEKAISNAIKGNNTGQVAEDLLKEIGDNPSAKKGLQRAFADHIISSAETTAKTIKNDPKTSHAAFARLIKKYRPAMRVLYKDEPMKLQAIENMQQAYEIMARNTYSPIGAGSDTSELLTTFANVATNMSVKARAVKTVLDIFKGLGEKRANAILNRTLFDPDGARTIQSVLNGKVEASQIEKVINEKIINLFEYKQSRVAQAATAAGVMVKNGNDN